MEEAQGYHALANEFKRSQDEIAKIVGKSRSHVANMMRLTKLPAEVQAYIALRPVVGRPRPRADRRARSGGRCQTHRRGRPQRAPGRGAGACRGRAGAQAAEGARRQGEGSRYGRAGEAGQRRARARGQRRSPRSRRHRADPLPQPRSARRDDAAAGDGLQISSAQPVFAAPGRSSSRTAAHPLRFAFTAIDSSTRCAMAAASGACLRISSAAVAS